MLILNYFLSFQLILVYIITMIMTITIRQKRCAHQKHTYYTYIKLQIEKQKHILFKVHY